MRPTAVPAAQHSSWQAGRLAPGCCCRPPLLSAAAGHTCRGHSYGHQRECFARRLPLYTPGDQATEEALVEKAGAVVCIKVLDCGACRRKWGLRTG